MFPFENRQVALPRAFAKYLKQANPKVKATSKINLHGGELRIV
jgi:hypothetical protein